MTTLELNPSTWFSERELPFKPRHFTATKTPITLESKKWIYDKLNGRFAIVTVETTVSSYDLGSSLGWSSTVNGFPAFENPLEAVFYELTWS